MTEAVERLADFLSLPVNILGAGIGCAAILAVGSTVRWVNVRHAPREERSKRLGSLLVWWGMLLVIACTLMAGLWGAVVTFGLVSLIAVYEYLRLLKYEPMDRAGGFLLYLAVPAMYACVLLPDRSELRSLVLTLTIVAITARLVLAGRTQGFLQTSSSLVWGAVIFIFGLSHAAMLLALPAESNPVAGPEGWLVYLILCTESADIFQALWGRRFGRHKITPVVSPNKTWEGLILGGLSALVMGLVFAPWLTPLAEPWNIGFGDFATRVPYVGILAAGVLLLAAGFFGDLNVSALKRDVGVKDTGAWLPSQGGILDRIDSLTFTAPAFYYFVRFCYA